MKNVIKTITGDDKTARKTQAMDFAAQYARRFGAVVTVHCGLYEDTVTAGEHGGTVVRADGYETVVDGVSITITVRDGGLYAELPRMSPERAHSLLQSVRPGNWSVGGSSRPETIGASI